MLTESEINKIKDKLTTCSRPFFIYDDDADGVCSYLLFYEYIREGKGYILKDTSRLGPNHIMNEIKKYSPDAIFILDIPVVLQEFLDEINIPVYWIDHHMPLDRNNVQYFNPRKREPDAYIPTSVLCYQVVKDNIWLGMVGAVADWHVPYFIEDFIKKYPDLLDKEIKTPEDLLYKSKVGELARIFSFSIKGKSSNSLMAIEKLKDIKDPYELFNSSTPSAKFIMDKFNDVNQRYLKIYNKAEKQINKSKLFVFKYEEDKWSFTSDLATELIAKNPDKIILIYRECNGRMRCSLRGKNTPVLGILEEALKGINGNGGGHENACGAVIDAEDFDQFIKNIEKEI